VISLIEVGVDVATPLELVKVNCCDEVNVGTIEDGSSEGVSCAGFWLEVEDEASGEGVFVTGVSLEASLAFVL